MSLAGQFSAVYAHEGYNLFKFVGKFLFPSLVVLIEGSEDLEKERGRNDWDSSFFQKKLVESSILKQKRRLSFL